MSGNRPFVLSIAGHDPSGGAGLLADIKTFEAFKVYGLGACSAITFQNDIALTAVNWVHQNDIFKQLDLLFERFPIEFVKIGVIENLQVLTDLIGYIKAQNPQAKIILDPVLKASAGYEFHNETSFQQLEHIANSLYLITPNWTEMNALFPQLGAEDALLRLGQHCNVLLKGGHRKDQTGLDLLHSEGKTVELPSSMFINTPKHGSGCVLSSAITALLAWEKSLEQACREAKTYTAQFLSSNESLLGYHNYA